MTKQYAAYIVNGSEALKQMRYFIVAARDLAETIPQEHADKLEIESELNAMIFAFNNCNQSIANFHKTVEPLTAN